jgi:hypothetical protein
MEARDPDTSMFAFTMVGCGEEANLMTVLARLKVKFDGLPSAFATSSE